MDWVDLAQDREKAGACEWDNELVGPIKWGEFLN